MIGTLPSKPSRLLARVRSTFEGDNKPLDVAEGVVRLLWLSAYGVDRIIY